MFVLQTVGEENRDVKGWTFCCWIILRNDILQELEELKGGGGVSL